MKPSILIINDIENINNELQNKLANHYNITLAQSKKEGLEELTSARHLIALIDLQAFDDEGVSIMAEFQRQKHGYTSVVAMSINDDDETILKSFELGADQFISSNADLKVISQKVATLVSFKHQVLTMQQEESKLTSLVNTSMEQAAFYGSCINLISDIQLKTDPASLAESVFNYMKQFGIGCAISFRPPKQFFEYDQETHYCSPLEKKVFQLLQDKGRIYEFGSRAMFNDSFVSLLIKNMPAKDTMKYGLYIDVFAKLVPALNTAFKALLNNKNIELAQFNLGITVNEVQAAVVELQNEKQKLVDNLVMEIGLSFHQYDFTDSQEAFLSEIIEKNVIQQAEQSDKFININNRLNTIIASMESLNDMQYIDDADISADIELF